MFIGRNPDGSIYGLWTVRQWDGQEELVASDPAVLAFLAPLPLDTRAGLAVDGEGRLRFEINFDQENRLRALEAKAAITRIQYRDALIARWKQLNP